VGVAFSSGYRVDQQIRIDFGESVVFEGYTLTAVDRYVERTPQRISAGAVIEVTDRNGRLVRTMRPRLNQFGDRRAVPTPAVMYTPTHDLYLNLNSTVTPTTSFVVLRVVKSPLVTWIWIGGFILALGTAYSLSGSGRTVPARASARSELAGEEGASA